LEAGNLRKATAGIGQLRQPVLDRGPEVVAADIDGHQAVAERQLGKNVAAGEGRGPRGDLAPPGGAPPWGRGRPLRPPPPGGAAPRGGSQTGWPFAAAPGRRGGVGLSGSPAAVPIGVSSSLLSSSSNFATTAATSGSGATVAVSITRNCGHQVVVRVPRSSFTSMAMSIAVT